jgi:hypothetical protein
MSAQVAVHGSGQFLELCEVKPLGIAETIIHRRWHMALALQRDVARAAQRS